LPVAVCLCRTEGNESAQAGIVGDESAEVERREENRSIVETKPPVIVSSYRLAKAILSMAFDGTIG
jgi:hypothetical protein